MQGRVGKDDSLEDTCLSCRFGDLFVFSSLLEDQCQGGSPPAGDVPGVLVQREKNDIQLAAVDVVDQLLVRAERCELIDRLEEGGEEDDQQEDQEDRAQVRVVRGAGHGHNVPTPGEIFNAARRFVFSVRVAYIGEHIGG